MDHFARLVANAELAANSYKLSVATYVEAEDTAEVVDIEGLDAEIAEAVARQQELREQIDAILANLKERA